MKVLRLILFPFTFIYGLVVLTRNLLYDLRIFKSFEFPIPIISVGNLTVGGAGKSPMTEYLVALLKNQYRIATLSRGYGRKTRGFGLVSPSSSAADVGDEPLQFKNKFPEITVAVAEKRVDGINRLLKDHDVIILDDAYQHRRVKPGFSILLFDYHSVLKPQWFLPTGNLREPLSGRRRADCLVVTKSPKSLSIADKEHIIRKVKPLNHQHVFFSYLAYGHLQSITSEKKRSLTSIESSTSVILLTAIANPAPLIEEVKKYTEHISHHSYRDHHMFTTKNIAKIAKEYHELDAVDKIIITTEKDLQRLNSASILELLQELQVYFLPVEAAFDPIAKAGFDQLIVNYVTERTRNN